MDPDIEGTTNPFATFAPSPQGVTFESQEEGEEIILLLRQHIVTLVPSVLTIIFLAIVPFIFTTALGFLRIDLTFLSPVQMFLLTVFWYLLVFTYTLYRFIFWYFNVYILSNERVIDFDFKGILHKQSSFTKLGQIEDVTPKMVGFFSTFFNYGDVYVQTAGESREFEFLKVPRPDAVTERIMQELRKEEGEAPGVIA